MDIKVKNLSISSQSSNTGVFGYTEDSIIKNVGFENITVHSTTHVVGGICGYSFNSTIEKCFFMGEVEGVNVVGGLCGRGVITIKDSYAIARVKGNDYVGGIMGYHNGLDFNNTYFSGEIISTFERIGGVIGGSNADISLITNSYWNQDLFPTSVVGTGLTDTQMRQKESFVGFDFNEVWDITDGFPFLRVLGGIEAPAKVESREIISYLDKFNSTLGAHKRSQHIPQSFLTSLEGVSIRGVRSKREATSYALHVNSFVEADMKTVIAKTIDLYTNISSIYSNVGKKIIKIQDSFAYVDIITGKIEVIAPNQIDKVINAYAEIIYNRSESEVIHNPSNSEVIY
ncbi:hypothetical protein CD798_07990 [Bacillaceae bacterium SAOS 7]|nr:hypothetical protein CD798_07990 [Bacillaceae bacterium SAOS 7]